MRKCLIRLMFTMVFGLAFSAPSTAWANSLGLAYPVGLVVNASAFGAAAAVQSGDSLEMTSLRHDFETAWSRSTMLPFLEALFQLRSRLYIEVTPQVRLVPLTERLSGLGLRYDF